MATSFDAATARANLLAERGRLLEELGEPIVAPGQMTYGSQAAAASHVFEQQRDLALRDRSRIELTRSRRPCERLDDGTVRHLRRAAGSRSRRSGSRRSRGPRSASTAPERARDDRRRAAAAHAADANRRRRPARHDRRRSARPRRISPAWPSGRRWCRSAPPVRADPGPAQGRITPADRRVQDPRRLPRDRLARRPRSGRAAWSPTRPAITPRASPAPHACSAFAAVVVMPSNAPRDQAPASRGGRRGDRDGRAGERRARRPWPSGSPPSAASCSSRPTTTTGSSPARARSGSRSPRTCRISPPC